MAAPKFVADDMVLGKITHVVLVEDKKHKLNLEIGFTSDKKLITGNKDDGTETVTGFDSYCRLFVDDCELKEEDNKDLFDKAVVRRGITRDAIQAVTGERLDDNWSEKGYQRLTPDAKGSVVPAMVGKEVIFKAREFNNSVMWNLYTPRPTPPAMNLKDLKEKLRKKQG